MLSKHAKIRSQQRGIPPLLVDLLRDLGASEKAPGGTTVYYFDKKARRRFEAYAGPIAGVLQQHLDAYIVVGKDDQVITTGHRLQRIQKH
uniref:hypothetical protein n=1 Tax=Hylemonella sp. TaxID=2066020 RepID=UPI0035B43561